MRKLSLHFNKPIQGKFSLEKLNFLFVFQVNCPGCFFYGIPMVNDLYAKYNKHISFLGLSTAFEDYDFKIFANGKLISSRPRSRAGSPLSNFTVAQDGRYKYSYTPSIDFLKLDRNIPDAFLVSKIEMK